MSEGWPKGRQLEPIEVFEVTPWRALALFRVATLAYSVILTAHNFNNYPHPYAAWVVIVGMAVWTGITIAAYERARRRAWPMLLADLTVTAVCVLATRLIVG